jgi:hypothetical protein
VAGAGGSAGGSAGTGGIVSGCSAGSLCASTPPTGWQGPWYLFRGPAGATPPSCPGAAAATLAANIKLSVGSSTCGCSCSGTSNCANSLGVTLSQSSCGSAPCSTKSLPAGQCVQLDSACSAYATVGAAPAPGPCTPVPNPSIPAPTWDEVVRACAAPTTGTCADGACVTPPSSPFSTTLCIGKQGNQPCSAPGYPTKVLGHQGFTDTRSCSSCYCSAQTCGRVTLYPNGCSSSISKQVLPGTCGPGYAVGAGVSSVFARYSNIGGGCVAVKPSPSGTVVEASPFTLCCAL